MNFKKSVLMCSLALSASVAVAEGEPLSFFMAMGGAYQKISTQNDTVRYSIVGSAPEVRAGVRYEFGNRYGVALSGGALLGTVDQINMTYGGSQYTIRNQTSVIVDFEPSYFFNYNSRVFAIGGVSTYKMVILGDHRNHLDTKPHYGLGAEVRLNREFSVLFRGVFGSAGNVSLSKMSDGIIPLNSFKYHRFSLGVAYTL